MLTKHKNSWLVVLGLLLHGIALGQKKPTNYVDPFIGTLNDGNTYPGAVTPWGMISVNPFNVDVSKEINKGTSYQKGQPYIYGFSHTRLSGVGCPDMGSVLLMPSQGETTYLNDSLKSNYTNETASAGYYAVDLLKHQIKAEMTATTRTAISKYSFKKQGNNFITLDLGESLSKQKGAYIHKISENEIEGYKTDGGFCGNPVSHKVYFYLVVAEDVHIRLWDKEKQIEHDTAFGNAIGAFITPLTGKVNQFTVKVGISYVSMENAKLNMLNEQPTWDFNAVKKLAAKEWDKELSKILVEGKSEADKRIFYTGIYHILQHPNIINDVNGEYPAMGSHETRKSTRNHYSVFSLWDTYRNVHPFLTLVYPERQSDMVASMVDMYKETGWLPKWELAANETNVMVGDPALPVIADTYLKGIKNFDVDTAYQAMVHNASLAEPHHPIRPGLQQYLDYGFIPNDDKKDVWGSVATTLEYSFADWSLAQMAKALGKESDYQIFTERSQFYKNVFDGDINFMRPKLKNGKWQTPFDPTTVNGELSWNPSGGPGFVEGSSWQYTWFVPHDIKGLKLLMGGDKAFTNHLQMAFDSSYFALWNEPDMAYPYLFNYVAGEEWRTQKFVKQSIKKYFSTTAAGLPGNDDCGTMSAWLVFSMMGFYPDCPASLQYSLTKPAFDKISISLNQDYYPGKCFTIKASGNGDYIKSVSLNGKKSTSYFINHQKIVNGETLIFNNKP